MVKKSDKPSRVGLYIFGVIVILVGLFFILASAVTLKLTLVNSQMPNLHPWSLSLLEFIMGSSIIALGVGTFMAKRWARKTMLILSWFWLIVGAITMAVTILSIGPNIKDAMNASGQAGSDYATGVIVGKMVGKSVFHLILAGIFVLFFQSKKFLAAVEFYDSKPSWTDACPTPVLAVSFLWLLWVLTAATVVLMFGIDRPYFGLPFWQFKLYSLFVFGVLAAIVVGFCKLDMKAWWLALAFLVVGGVAYFYIFGLMYPAKVHVQMGSNQTQSDLMESMALLKKYESATTWGWLVMTPYLAYLLYIRKYFLKKRK